MRRAGLAAARTAAGRGSAAGSLVRICWLGSVPHRQARRRAGARPGRLEQLDGLAVG